MTADLDPLMPPVVSEALNASPDASPIGAAGALDVSVGRVRREQLRQLLRSKAFIIGALILLWWIVCAIFGSSLRSFPRHAGKYLEYPARPVGRPLVRDQ